MTKTKLKTKSVILSLVLCCFALLGIFTLVGCGSVTVQTLSEQFDELDAVYEQYSNIFTSTTYDGIETNYYISSYGTTVDNEISSNTEGYVELLNIYNATLIIANDYTDSNRDYVLSLDQDSLSKDSKTALKAVSESLEDYIESIYDFVEARSILISHFENFAGNSNASDEASLLRFKKVYGNMVSNAVTLSTKMAEMVETTSILDLLKRTDPTTADTVTVKDYIRAKLLPIFSELRITEIENKLNWNAQLDGDGETKERITALMSELDTQFESFKEIFVKTATNKLLSTEQMNDLFELAEEFFKDAEQYYYALSSLDIYTLSVTYSNNMSNYLEVNELAEVFLQKLEQFVTISLPNFMEAVNSICS